MKEFLARFGDRIMGVISGFDRVLFRGRLNNLSYPRGFERFLISKGILLKEFGGYVEDATKRVKAASIADAQELDRPIRYLASSQARKEDVARRILEERPVDQGLICVLSCVEPCRTYELRRSKTEPLQLALRHGKCMHYYHYFLHPQFGFMHVRLQTWFPFTVQVCLNGRLWLARQLDHAGIGYVQSKNCFPWIDDPEQAQRLLDQQPRQNWTGTLDRLARQINPALDEILAPLPPRYYWTARQTEWATDVMFVDQNSLARVYPALVHHAITRTSSADVMRFLGRRAHGLFEGEIVSDFKDRPEGVRVKHSLDWNSLKLYDKEGSVLRVESTINDPSQLIGLRPDQNGTPVRQPLRKSVADLQRRVVACQEANERYLEHFVTADAEEESLLALIQPVCKPARFRKRRVRGLRPWSEDDIALLRSVIDGSFALRGFRNSDIASRLFSAPPRNEAERRRRRGQVTRRLQMLRAHRMVRRMPRTRRYRVTPNGHRIINAVLTAIEAPVAALAPVVDGSDLVVETFRHRDLDLILHGSRARRPDSAAQHHGKLTRLLRTLAHHELISRLPNSHAYALAPPGKRLIAAFIARGLTRSTTRGWAA